MKKLFNAPHLGKVENLLSLYFIFIPTIWMIWRINQPMYNPILFLFEGNGGLLNNMRYDDITLGMLLGMLFLIASNVLTAFVALRYRKNGVTKHTKKCFIAIYCIGFFEFYNRVLIYFVEDHPFDGEWGALLPLSALITTILQGGLFIWFTCVVFKRATSIPANGSLEAQLVEIDELKEKGVITDEEYAVKRSALLS